MSRVRPYLVGGAVGGMLLYTWALYNGSALFVNLPRIIGAFGSIIVFLLIGCLLAVTFKWFNNDRDGLKVDVWKFILTMGVLALLLLEVATVCDWWLGHHVRVVFGLTHVLPSGFLILASGRAGITYLVLAVVIVLTSFTGRKDKAKHTSKGADVHETATSSTTHHEASPRVQFTGSH